MKIYYIKISELINKYSKKEILTYSATNRISSPKRLLQHCAGRFLVQNTLKKIYNIKTPKIILINKKPQIENEKIHFSLAHSSDYVIAAFDEHACGIDIEYMRPIRLDLMSKRYNKTFKTTEDFYKFWTTYEASIKLGMKPEFKHFSIFQKDYGLSILSSHKIQSPIEFEDFLFNC